MLAWGSRPPRKDAVGQQREQGRPVGDGWLRGAVFPENASLLGGEPAQFRRQAGLPGIQADAERLNVDQGMEPRLHLPRNQVAAQGRQTQGDQRHADAAEAPVQPGEHGRQSTGGGGDGEEQSGNEQARLCSAATAPS